MESCFPCSTEKRDQSHRFDAISRQRFHYHCYVLIITIRSAIEIAIVEKILFGNKFVLEIVQLKKTSKLGIIIKYIQ